MKLTKAEIQKMLREMHIEFDLAETYEELISILKKEHHKQWLKSRIRAETQYIDNSALIKRKNNESWRKNYSENIIVSKKATSYNPKTKNINKKLLSRESYNNIKILKSMDSSKIKITSKDNYQYLIKTVLKRSKKRCELCGKREIEIIKKTPDGLKLCQIIPIKQGGINSRKNFVALCLECKLILRSAPNLKIIKKLKLKARKRIYSRTIVTRKNK